MTKYINSALWIILILFTPLTFLGILSQNTIPGDFLYPFKRQLENTALALASTNPDSKASLQTELTDRRFSEAEALLVTKVDTTALNDFFTQVETTTQAVDSLKDLDQKEALREKMLSSIEEYEIKLNQAEIKLQSTPTPTSAPQSQPPLQNTGSQNPPNNSVSTVTNNTSQQSSPITPTISTSKTTLTTPTTPIAPPSTTPSPAPSTSLAELEKRKNAEESLKRAKEKLEKIKKTLEEKKGQKELEKETRKEEQDQRKQNRKE